MKKNLFYSHLFLFSYSISNQNVIRCVIVTKIRIIENNVRTDE